MLRPSADYLNFPTGEMPGRAGARIKTTTKKPVANQNLLRHGAAGKFLAQHYILTHESTVISAAGSRLGLQEERISAMSTVCLLDESSLSSTLSLGSLVRSVSIGREVGSVQH